MNSENQDSFPTLVRDENSPCYEEFGGFSYNTILNKLHVSEVVTQVNAVEFEMNDILANQSLPEGFSEAEYLNYIQNELMDKRIPVKEKGKRLISLFESTDGFERLKPEFFDNTHAKRAFDKWLAIRNRFAHGQIVFNSKKMPVIYFSGECFNIETSTQCFFDCQEKIIEILARYRELRSPYYGKPVLKDSNNTPDNPK